jgi:hypothetical protein
VLLSVGKTWASRTCPAALRDKLAVSYGKGTPNVRQGERVKDTNGQGMTRCRSKRARLRPFAHAVERLKLAEGGRTQSIKRRRASAIRRFCARTLPRNEPLQRHEAEQCERAAQREVRTASGYIDDACANGRAYRDRHLNHADEERRASLRRIGDTSLDPDTAAQGALRQTQHPRRASQRPGRRANGRTATLMQSRSAARAS